MKTRKPLSILLTLCLIVGLIPWTVLPARAASGTFAELQGLLNKGGTVKLEKDYTAGENETELTVGSGKTVTLDLNGHTVDRGLAGKSDVSGGGVVIVDGGTLTLTDSAGGGKLTGGNKSGNGGGVFVDHGGAFTMCGGTISGNKASAGGGVTVLRATSTFVMEGGSIAGNEASSSAGGVFVRAGAAFTMNGGMIAGNTVSGDKSLGGGVYTMETGTFTMTGGTISGNNGGGVYVGGGAFTLTGGVITGNTVNGAANNVYLPSGKTVTVTGALKGASVGVKLASGYGDNAFAQADDGYNGGALTAGDCAAFFSDDAAYGVMLVDGTAKLAAMQEVGSWSDLYDALQAGGCFKLTEDCSYVADQPLSCPGGKTVTLDLSGHVLDRGLTEAAENGWVIKVDTDAGLTLTDSNSTATHDPAITYTDPIDSSKTVTVTGGVITGGNNATDGGGVFVGNYGTFAMNGGTITGNTAVVEGGGVYVEGTFTINGGMIAGNTVSGADSLGGGVYVYGTFAMNGGTISGNEAEYSGGGVFVGGSSGKFTMNDGTISGNTAVNEDAGGVLVASTFNMNGGTISDNVGAGVEVFGSGATFNMTGGTISGNTDGGVSVGRGAFNMNGGTISGNTAQYGGGVYVGHNTFSTTFNMTGGTISNNTATDGGGVYICGKGTFKVSGSPVVTGNTVSGTANNVYLESGKKIIVAGALTSGASIGVTLGSGYDDAFTNELSGRGTAANFTSDNGAYLVVLDGSGEAELATVAKPATWDALYSALQADGYVILTKDVKYGTGSGDNASSALEVPKGKTVTLDLAGHVIDRGLSEEAEDGCVVMVSGDLTLVDNNSEATHEGDYASLPAGGVITGGNNSSSNGSYSGGVYVKGGSFTMTGGTITRNTTGYGGGVYVYGNSGGTFNMNGGTIVGNTAEYGGGVCVNGGTFNMSDGTITGNAASGKGGGVCVGGENASFTMEHGTIAGNVAEHGGGVFVSGENASFTMNDGTISGNAASNNGGGVCIGGGLCPEIEFTMTGGSVTGNNAGYGGGVFVASEHEYVAAFNVSGGATVKDNFSGGTKENGVYIKGDSGAANNVYLEKENDTAKITVTGELTGGENAFGVTLPGNYGTGAFTSGLSGNGTAANFTSDAEGYDVVLNDDGEAELAKEVSSGACGATESDNVTWTLNGGTLTISGTGAMADFEYENGSVNQPWKADCADITAVVIEEGVTHIGKNAFKNCTNFPSVIIPASVTSIGYGAFYTSYDYNLSKNKLASVTFAAGSQCATIGDYAFEYQPITSVTLPESVASIGCGAFQYDSALASVTFNSSALTIGEYAFQGAGLTSVTLDDNVTSIGQRAFQSCRSLASATITGNGTTTIGEDAFADCTSLKTVEISGVAAIAGHRFYTGALETLKITGCESGTSIGDYAFSSAASLTSLTLDGNVTSIGSNAFSGCSSLTSITLPCDFDKTLFTVNGSCITPSEAGFTVANTQTVGTFAYTHDISYTSNGATITAACPCQHISATLTITAPTLTVCGGSGSASATLDGLSAFNTATGLTVAATDIKYVGRDGTTYTESATAPTNVGKYTASITVESKTASVEYEIGKAKGPAAPTDLAGVAPTSGANNDGKITGVTTAMEYSTASDFRTKTACTGTEITALAAGTYYVRIAETDTHEAGEAATVEVPAYSAPTYTVQNGVVTAPEGAVLILATYDSKGKMTSVQSKTLTADCVSADPAALLGLTSLPASYKLMLVDGGSFAPLCAAWDSAKN